MKVSPTDEIASHLEGARGLERILMLETKLALAPVIGLHRRQLVKAIGIAAAAYRMTLDNEQASAARDRTSLIDRATVRRFPRRKQRRSKRSPS